MTVAEFWNQAFLAALSRVSAREAAREADDALEKCVHMWQPSNQIWLSDHARYWKNHSVVNVPRNRSAKRLPTWLYDLKWKLSSKHFFKNLCRVR